MLVKLALLDELLLLGRNRPQAPPSGVGVPLHDHTLNLGHATVVASRHHCSRHLCNANSNGLALGCHQDHLIIALDARLKAEESRDHELGTVADGIDSAVLHDEALEVRQENLEGHDDAAQVGLVLEVVERPLGVEEVMHGHHVLGLPEDAGPHTTELLHVPSNTEQQPKVHTERPDVGAGLTGEPEGAEVALLVVLDHLALVDRADAQLTLDGRDERGPLEQGAREGLKGTGHLGGATLHSAVEAGNTHVLLAGALLGLDEPRGAVDADNEVPGDLGIQGSAVPCLFAAEDPLDPGYHLAAEAAKEV